MTDPNNHKNWVTLFLGACSGIFGFWQLRRGVAYGRGIKRILRTKDPVGFWIIVCSLLGLSGFFTLLAILHWH
jgi:hypothetical protein